MKRVLNASIMYDVKLNINDTHIHILHDYIPSNLSSRHTMFVIRKLNVYSVGIKKHRRMAIIRDA